jgi:D-beta-D-heptose 7-phosphate kinase/D-beta-D-heptose 1-phosphate adenosyltransferase
MKELLRKFTNARVLVFGDVMLDTYLQGSVDRISPEAPVPVLNVVEKRSVPGGAANVAMNVRGLGAEVFLVGAVGEDAEGVEVRDVLEASGITSRHLVSAGERPTTVKTRLIAHQQQVARFDREDVSDHSTEEIEELWKVLEPLTEACDAAIVSDYAKGVVGQDICSRLITKLRSLGKPVLVDPKGTDFSKYSGATLLTPNEKEALAAASHALDTESALESVARYLIETVEVDALLVTRGEKGMVLYEAGNPPVQIDAHKRYVYDVTGAGDTVIASLGVAAAAGADLSDACELANLAAGFVVERLGTSAIALDELLREAEAAGSS